MAPEISALWSKPLPEGLHEKITDCLAAHTGSNPVRVFFRADDIAHPDVHFSSLMRMFQAHEVPLCLALVPGWMERANWKNMEQYDAASPLWCWHQHGWNHVNHEPQGKKCEFGRSRTENNIRADLEQGRKRLLEILGDQFFPVFTPPWNRCSLETMELLVDLGYAAVSRSQGAHPAAPEKLADIAINVDLHTRREDGFQQGWAGLLSELHRAAESGRIGIMIHHQLMNDQAVAFLDMLLRSLKGNQRIAFCTFRELVQEYD